MKLLEQYTIGNTELKNRVVMEPMCMYSVFKHEGVPTSFHLAHYVSRAIGQVGLIIVEATGVVPEGRITDQCLGLYNDEQMKAFIPIVDAVHEQGSMIAVQLNHAGRKCSAVDGVDTIYGPSAIAFDETYRTPKEMSEQDIQDVFKAFQDAAIRADKAGFDGIEIHGAHGYLISEFMSPISNQRSDKYKDGKVFINELTQAIKEVWPSHKFISIRVSATDYEEHGYHVDDTIRMLSDVKDDYDIFNISSGGITPIRPTALYPGYQVRFATEIKEALGRPVIACGLLDDHNLASFVLESGQADMIGLARPLLKDPHWVLNVAQSRRKMNLIPFQYERGFK